MARPSGEHLSQRATILIETFGGGRAGEGQSILRGGRGPLGIGHVEERLARGVVIAKTRLVNECAKVVNGGLAHQPGDGQRARTTLGCGENFTERGIGRPGDHLGLFVFALHGVGVAGGIRTPGGIIDVAARTVCVRGCFRGQLAI